MNEELKKRLEEYFRLLNAIKEDESILDYVDSKYNEYYMLLKNEEVIKNENNSGRQM